MSQRGQAPPTHSQLIIRTDFTYVLNRHHLCTAIMRLGAYVQVNWAFGGSAPVRIAHMLGSLGPNSRLIFIYNVRTKIASRVQLEWHCRIRESFQEQRLAT